MLMMGLGGASMAVAQTTITYTYDVFGRLVTSASTGASLQATYTYDAADNRTALAVGTYVALLKSPTEGCNKFGTSGVKILDGATNRADGCVAARPFDLARLTSPTSSASNAMATQKALSAEEMLTNLKNWQITTTG